MMFELVGKKFLSFLRSTVTVLIRSKKAKKYFVLRNFRASRRFNTRKFIHTETEKLMIREI